MTPFEMTRRRWLLGASGALVCLAVLIGWMSYTGDPSESPSRPGVRVSGISLCPAPDMAADQGHSLIDWAGDVGAIEDVRGVVLLDTDGTSVKSVEIVIGDASVTPIKISINRDFSGVQKMAKATVKRGRDELIRAEVDLKFAAPARGTFPVFLAIHYDRRSPCESSVDEQGLAAVRIGTFVAA